MNPLLHSPYHALGAIVARVAVNAATLIWSLVVLVSDNALGPTPYGAALVAFAPENFYGWFFGAIAALNLYRIFRQSKPHPIGIVGYAILMAGWGYVEIIMLLVQRPLYPTAVAWVSVGTALAVYGFVANPRRRDDRR